MDRFSRKFLPAASLLAFLVFYLTPCLAADGLVFGPREFSVSSWRIHLSFHTFSAQTPGEGQLLIRKSEGEAKIRSGFIILNTGIIPLQSFLQGSEKVFERNLDLRSRNYMVVFLTGAPGASITLEIRASSSSVPPPEVEFTALPASIKKGEKSTLQWSTTHAESVEINQGIGTVASIGTLEVSPQKDTEYVLAASGQGGTATRIANVEVIEGFMLSILSPAEGQRVESSHVLVRGSVTAHQGVELGVKVNGFLALVDGEAFAVNRVPIDEGENVITAEAIDANGNRAEASLRVYGLGGEGEVEISIRPRSGLAPLEAEIRLDAALDLTNPSLTSTGPGTVEFLERPGVGAQSVRMATPGLYTFTVEARNDEGKLYTDSAVVQVLDAGVLDALLKQKWNRMKTALGAGDTETALSYFSKKARTMFQHSFNLMSAKLGEIAAGLEEIRIVSASDIVAECEMLAQQEGRTYSFYVLFVKDHDGLWRIDFF